jgi:hypothetical protein
MTMTAFNVVRFRVRPGCEQPFIEAHRKLQRDFSGFITGHLIRTGDRTFCLVGEWRSFAHIVKARPAMIGLLDSFRELLEDLGGGLGVTDPVSGEVVARIARPKAAKKKTAGKGKKKAGKKPKAKARKRR